MSLLFGVLWTCAVLVPSQHTSSGYVYIYFGDDLENFIWMQYSVCVWLTRIGVNCKMLNIYRYSKYLTP